MSKEPKSVTENQRLQHNLSATSLSSPTNSSLVSDIARLSSDGVAGGAAGSYHALLSSASSDTAARPINSTVIAVASSAALSSSSFIVQNKFDNQKNNVINNKFMMQNALHCSIKAQDIVALRCLLNQIKENNIGLNTLITAEQLFILLAPIVRNDQNLYLVQFILDTLGIDLKELTVGDTHATLLSEAALYGAVKIVSFLLTKGYDPNHQDCGGSNVLHRAVYTNQVATVKVLLQHPKLEIDKKNKADCTPLHIAACRQNQEIISALLKAKANIKLPGPNGLNFIALTKEVKEGNGELTPINLTVALTTEEMQELSLSKAISAYSKGLFADSNNEHYLRESISLFQKYLNKLHYSEENALNVGSALSYLAFLYEFFKYTNSNELKQYIINYATKIEQNAILVKLYNILCCESLAKVDFYEAKTYAELAHKACTKDIALIYTGDQHNVMYNLGLAWKWFDSSKSLEYLEQAEKLDPNDDDTKEEKVFANLRQGFKDKALYEAAKITDADLRDLLIIYIHFNSNCDDLIAILKQYNFVRFEGEYFYTTKLVGDSKHNLYMQIKADILLQNHSYTEAIDCYNKFVGVTGLNNVPFILSKILSICIIGKLWDLGLHYIQNYYQTYQSIMQNHNYLPLKYYEFVFYDTQGNTSKSAECLTFLLNSASLGNNAYSLAKKAKFIHFISLIHHHEYEKAQIWAQVLDPIDVYTIKYNIFLKILQQAESNKQVTSDLSSPAASSSSSFSSSEVKQQSILDEEVSFVTLEWMQQAEEFESLTPKAIHQYFQLKKQALVSEKIDGICEQHHAQANQTWHTQKYTYKYVGDEDLVCKILNKDNFYAVIEPALAKKLDQSLLSQFNKALTKGLVSKDQHSVGIKFIPGKLVELKINGDARLVATNILKQSGPDGKYLIVFNKLTDHVKIQKIINKSELHVVLDTNYASEDDVVIEDAKVDFSKTLADVGLSHDHHDISDSQNTELAVNDTALLGENE